MILTVKSFRTIKVILYNSLGDISCLSRLNWYLQAQRNRESTFSYFEQHSRGYDIFIFSYFLLSINIFIFRQKVHYTLQQHSRGFQLTTNQDPPQPRIVCLSSVQDLEPTLPYQAKTCKRHMIDLYLQTLTPIRV